MDNTVFLDNFEHYLKLTQAFPCRTISYRDTLANINNHFFKIDAQTSINRIVRLTFESHNWKSFYSYQSQDHILSNIDTWAYLVQSLPIKHPLCIQYYGNVSTIHPGSNRLLMYEQITDPVVVILNDHVGNFSIKDQKCKFDIDELMFRVVNIEDLPMSSHTRIHSTVDVIKELVPKNQSLHYPTKENPPALFEWKNNTVYKNNIPVVEYKDRWRFCI